MNFLSRQICPRRLSAVAILLSAFQACACGPEFPNRYLDAGAERLLAVPEGCFAAEIARLQADGVIACKAVKVPGIDPRARVDEIDAAELKQALVASGVSDSRATGVFWRYEDERRKLAALLAEREKTKEVSVLLPGIAVPQGLPPEFEHYFAGAMAYHAGRIEEARAEWERVLALPSTERKWRSTWAAYMLGRSWVPKDHDDRDAARQASEAARRFVQVRELAGAGFADALGLAAESYGWEAKAALMARDYAAAINLYIAQRATGNDTAIDSLRLAAAEALIAEPEVHTSLAADNLSRRVITAYVLSQFRPGDYETDNRRFSEWAKTWALALQSAGIKNTPDADRLAWAAYEGGLFALAQTWLQVAPDSGPARWVRAKLALRAGRLAEGEQHLAEAAAAGDLTEVQRAQVWAELGRVRLTQGNYAGALDAWLAGGQWEDAAYIGERVMSLEELRGYVDAKCPDSTRPVGEGGKTMADDDNQRPWANPAETRAALRHLLARRLARAGTTEAAIAYFPEKLRTRTQAYGVDVRSGFDTTRPAAERATAFWRAAETVHEFGLDLLGTELEPDWAIWNGDFEGKSAGEARSQEVRLSAGIFATGPDEVDRVTEHRVPERRYHYRYRAAELAWWAASLLPNDSDETARILDTAGRWLKGRDPNEARRFYQALVIRCGNTKLGRAAAQQRWFPKTTRPEM